MSPAIEALAQLFATQSFITRDEFLHTLDSFAASFFGSIAQ
jgi:hypothetical protein